MIRCSCHGLHGCVPVAPSATPSLVGELVQLLAALAEPRRGLVEGVAAAGADLDLGGDQLADEVLLERRALRRGLQVLEAVGQVERLGIEDGELLLDRDREVLRGLELLAGEARAAPPG